MKQNYCFFMVKNFNTLLSSSLLFWNSNESNLINFITLKFILALAFLCSLQALSVHQVLCTPGWNKSRLIYTMPILQHSTLAKSQGWLPLVRILILECLNCAW